jgi:chloramphenicol O-acetyltransferase type A
LKIIDLQSWPRRSHYEFFRAQASPHFSLTAAVDASHLMEVMKPGGASLFNAALYAIMAAANAVPELRTRFSGDRVTEYELVSPSVTAPIEDEKFVFCDIRFTHDWPDFDARCREAMAAAQQQTELAETVAGEDGWIFLSCLPWVHFTSMTNPLQSPDDCTPRITWGRIEKRDGVWRMPVGIQAHHALVDGVHAAMFYRELEQRLTKGFV